MSESESLTGAVTSPTGTVTADGNDAAGGRARVTRLVTRSLSPAGASGPAGGPGPGIAAIGPGLAGTGRPGRGRGLGWRHLSR